MLQVDAKILSLKAAVQSPPQEGSQTARGMLPTHLGPGLRRERGVPQPALRTGRGKRAWPARLLGGRPVATHCPTSFSQWPLERSCYRPTLQIESSGLNNTGALQVLLSYHPVEPHLRHQSQRTPVPGPGSCPQLPPLCPGGCCHLNTILKKPNHKTPLQFNSASISWSPLCALKPFRL